MTAPWIIFEAGAISKQLDSARVCPLLFGVTPADVKGPLEQFQCSAFSKEEVRKLLKSINDGLGESALDASVLDNVFEMWWPKLEKEVGEVLQAKTQSDKPKRTELDMLEELVLLARRTYGVVENNTSIGTPGGLIGAPIEDLAVRYDALVKAISPTASDELFRAISELSEPMKYLVNKYARKDGVALFAEARSRLFSIGVTRLNSKGTQDKKEKQDSMLRRIIEQGSPSLVGNPDDVE